MDETTELESQFFQEGLELGIKRGRTIGLENGKRHGREEGHQIGFEVGFALGVAETMAILKAEDESIVKAVKGVNDAVEKVRMDMVPRHEDLHRVRARFKVLESRAGLALSGSDQKDLTF